MARVALIVAATAVAVTNAFVPPAGGVLPTLRTGMLARHAARDPRTGIALRMSADGPADSKFAKLMADCKDWGLCRFITINPAGAVLETASPMDVGLNFFEIPGKVGLRSRGGMLRVYALDMSRCGAAKNVLGFRA